MELQLILNDLSLGTSASDTSHAQACMGGFVALTVRAVRYGAKSILRVPRGFETHMLCEGYPISKWRNDPQVDRDQRRYFNIVVSKLPYLDDLPNIQEELKLVEFEVDGISAKGLGVALALDGLAMSVRFTDRWDKPLISIQQNWIDLEGDGALCSSTEDVHHASRAEHLLVHEQWITERTQPGPQDGSDIWKRRQELLPCLEFCKRVEDELQKLRPAHVMLRPVFQRLRELNDYASEWQDGPFDPADLPSKVTPESQKAIEEHEDELTFLCPDGQNRLFSWHMRMTPGAWRLHFYPDGNGRRIIVGRIGKKPFV